jgi:rhodanese-related sulfurtransferase
MNPKPKFSNTIFKAIIIVCVGFVIGILNNTFSRNGIELIGEWGNKTISDSLVVPNNYQPDDPEALTLSQALESYKSGEAIFIDCRLKEDYDLGHISGAVNLPWEEFEEYYPPLKSSLSESKEMIVYCDGDECELSLLLARELSESGYENVKVFFGGWVEWKNASLPIEK